MTEFLQQIEQIGWVSWVRESPRIFAFPGILLIHTIGMGLMIFSFDLALTGISSLLGALLIVQHINVKSEMTRQFLLIAFAVLGIVLQSTITKKKKEETKT